MPNGDTASGLTRLGVAPEQFGNLGLDTLSPKEIIPPTDVMSLNGPAADPTLLDPSRYGNVPADSVTDGRGVDASVLDPRVLTAKQIDANFDAQYGQAAPGQGPSVLASPVSPSGKVTGVGYGAGAGQQSADATPAWQSIKDPYARAAYKSLYDQAALDAQDLVLLQQNGSKGGQYIDPAVAGALQNNLGQRNKLMDEQDALREKMAQRSETLGTEQEIQANVAADRAHEYGTQLADQNAKLATARADAQQKLEALQGSLDKQRDDFVKTAAKVDPNRMLKSGGNQVMAGLAVALGAFGSAFTHGPNYALQIVNDSLNRDLEAQKAGVEAKREGLSLAQQAYAQKAQLFENKIAAQQAAKADVYDAYAAFMDEHSKRLAGTQQGVAAQQSADAFRAEGLAQRQNALALEAQTLNAKLVRTVGATPSSLDRMAKAAEAKLKIDKAFGGGTTNIPPQDRNLANKNIGQIGELASSLREIQNLSKENENSNVLSRTLGVGEGRTQNRAEEIAVQNYTKAMTGSQHSDAEMARYAKVFNAGFTADQKNVGLHQLTNNGVGRATTLFAEIPDALKPAAAQRLAGMGFSPAQIQQIVSGKPPTSGADTVSAEHLQKPE